MDDITAEKTVEELRLGDTGSWRKWRSATHIATTCFRDGVLDKLNRDWQLKSMHGHEAGCNLVEIHLSQALPDIDRFEGIFEVDDIGIWYFDGDGHVNDPVWRQRVIPWRFITGIVLHQAS